MQEPIGEMSLAIKEVAEQTGIPAGTIRMWEQRYGFPAPERTQSGYRRYSVDDVATLKRALAFRDRGLSVAAALERAREQVMTDRPSIYGAIAGGDAAVRPQVLRKRTLNAISMAMEDEALARGAAPIVVGAFQREQNYRGAEHRYRQLARTADAVVVFADFPQLSGGGDVPLQVPIAPEDALGNEWAVVVDAPGYAACLLAWEQPGANGADPSAVQDDDRRFESVWTLDPRVVRRATQVATALIARADEDEAARLRALLADRPLAAEAPSPGLTAVTNRMIAYMEA